METKNSVLCSKHDKNVGSFEIHTFFTLEFIFSTFPGNKVLLL